jgi:histidinol-phosphate aminotransferase
MDSFPNVQHSDASERRRPHGTLPDPGEALRHVRGTIRQMAGYVPGLQPGPGVSLVKLNTNENPFPPSPRVIDALHRGTDDSLRLYPNPAGDSLREQAARTYGLSPEQVLCGNGSDEILAMLMRTFAGEGEAVAWFTPSYSLYPVLAGIAGARTVEVPLPRVAGREQVAAIPVPSPEAKLFFLTSPNSPYGFGFPTVWIARLLALFPGIVVADEAYVDFASESSLPLLAANPRLVVVRSFSKAYSLAGMRIGLAFAHPAVIAEMDKVKDSYNVSRLAQAAACAALADAEYLRQTRDGILATRGSFASRLAGLGFTVVPSDANFVFAVPPAGLAARALYDGLVGRGFLVRHFGAPGLSDGLRISIGRKEDMEALLRAIEEVAHGSQ